MHVRWRNKKEQKWNERLLMLLVFSFVQCFYINVIRRKGRNYILSNSIESNRFCLFIHLFYVAFLSHSTTKTTCSDAVVMKIDAVDSVKINTTRYYCCTKTKSTINMFGFFIFIQLHWAMVLICMTIKLASANRSKPHCIILSTH